MRLRHFFRVLARSRSLRFVRDSEPGRFSSSRAKIRWRGRDVFYRPGTSDPVAIYQVLLRKGEKAEYYLPRALDPKIIVDVGSNIGTSILYFHSLFPAARIFGFEPHPKTFEVLRSNVGDIAGVSIFNYGLGATDEEVSIPHDDQDFSAFSTSAVQQAARANLTVRCEIKHTGRAMNELGIAQLDLLKMDCEGAEKDVITSLPPELLRSCKWIAGEMHDASAFEILNRLAPFFDLDLRKTMFSPVFRFHACNLKNASELRGYFDRRALQG